MLQLMQSDNPVSCETGILNRKWKALRFIFAKRFGRERRLSVSVGAP